MAKEPKKSEAKQQQQEDKAQAIIARMEALESKRSNFDTLYQDCADYGMPGDNQIINRESEGQARPDTYQTVAENSIIQNAAGLYSYLFPTDSKAFVLRIDDEKLAENEEVKTWLDRVTTLIHEYLIQSNFRQGFFEFLKQLACYGTGCQYEEKGKKQPINFIAYHIAGIYISLDSDRNVDTVYRSFEFTARQAVQEFGEDNLGETIMAAYNDPKKKDNTFKFIHAVEPREDAENKGDPLTMAWSSTYVCRDDKSVVDESGYPELPYQVTFFDRDAMETYGRSPMMKMLPDIKMLGSMKKVRIKAWEKMCDPPMVMPDDGSLWPLATQPAGVIYKTPGGEDPTWFEFKGNMQGLQEAIAEVKLEIREGFFLDLFDALIDRQNMTATEVMARIEQKLRMLIHIIGRLQSGYFNPMINRVISILSKQPGKLPQIPEVLKGKEFKIDYLGRIALALKGLETEGFTKTMEVVGPLVEAGITDFIDNFDIDKITRDVSMNSGMPATWLKATKDRDAERDARRKKQDAMAMMEQAPELAKGLKNLSQAPEEGSPAQEMINAQR
jgi:hypothetical protein